MRETVRTVLFCLVVLLIMILYRASLQNFEQACIMNIRHEDGNGWSQPQPEIAHRKTVLERVNRDALPALRRLIHQFNQ